jgi:hypothetical protein
MSARKIIAAGAGKAAVWALAAVVPAALMLCGAWAAADGAGINATAPSSPITLSGISLSAEFGSQLFFVYANRSPATVEQFQISGAWLDASQRVVGRFRRTIDAEIWPGERTTATIDDLPGIPPHAVLKLAVTRVRFGDFSLWVAPVAKRVAAQARQAQPPAFAPSAQRNRAPSAARAFIANPRPFGFAPLQVYASPPTRSATLPAGTLLDVSLGAGVDSAGARNGTIVPFIAAHDVVVDGMTAIVRGAVGYGHLSAVGRAANWGRSGSLTLVADAVQAADGSMVELYGGQTVAPARVRPSALAQLSIIGGFFVRGADAVLPAGTIVQVVCAKTTLVADRH